MGSVNKEKGGFFSGLHPAIAPKAMAPSPAALSSKKCLRERFFKNPDLSFSIYFHFMHYNAFENYLASDYLQYIPHYYLVILL